MIVFTPEPSLFIGPWELSTHGVLLALGFLVALLAGRQTVRRRGLNTDIADGLAVAGVLAGFVGARVIYILTLGNDMTPLQMLKVWEGGLSSHGGYLFGMAAAVLYLRYKKVSVAAYTDALMPFFLIGWAIGRIGCLLNWDSYGSITSVPWAFLVNGESRHPTQLYETVSYLIGFGVVRSALKFCSFMKIPGVISAFSLALFVGARFVIDFVRGDVAHYVLFSQLVTGFILIGAVWYLTRQVVNYLHGPA